MRSNLEKPNTKPSFASLALASLLKRELSGFEVVAKSRGLNREARRLGITGA